MDQRQRELIKEKFLSLAKDEGNSLLGDLIDGIIEETEHDRIARENRAREKQDIMDQEAASRAAPGPEYNKGTKDNPLGFNRAPADWKVIIADPFETKEEHDRFMGRLLRFIKDLEEMGTNTTTNNKRWQLEGEEVGRFARRMRDTLFPKQREKGKDEGYPETGPEYAASEKCRCTRTKVDGFRIDRCILIPKHLGPCIYGTPKYEEAAANG